MLAAVSKACTARPARERQAHWFGIWAVPAGGSSPESTGKESAAPDCRAARENIVSAASRIRSAMQQAEESARVTGVAPGTIRDIRRKYGMDWSNWNR
jgi:hypothetical protein